MTRLKCQKWLIISSLSITGFLLIFHVIAPTLGYPLTFAQSLRIIEISVPIFLSYLGTASSFIFQSSAKNTAPLSPRIQPFINLLVKAPVILFSLIFLTILYSFGWSNRELASPGVGMSVDEFAIFITTSLGILAVTTNIAVAYLFTSSDPTIRNHASKLN